LADQLTFVLPSQPALERGDYFISSSNAAVVDVIQTWHDWPQGKLVLVGPAGSGKTHLAHVWAALTGAAIVPAAGLAQAPVELLADGALAVEDVECIAGDAAAEQALFHLHNLALANGRPLLLSAATPPMRWGLRLPDLASRMQGTAIATVQPPDDALLAAVLVKQFGDRQLLVGPKVIDWLTRNMDRSFAAAAQIVAALDAASLAQSRAVTQPLAASVLDKLRQDKA